MSPAAAGSDAVSWAPSEALCTPTLWLLLASAFVAGVSATGVTLHLVPYLRQQGGPILGGALPSSYRVPLAFLC